MNIINKLILVFLLFIHTFNLLSANENYTKKSEIYGLSHNKIINELKKGGYILFIRHAHRSKDIDSFTLNILDHSPLRGLNIDEIRLKKGYCLSNIGTQESELLGYAILKLNIPFSKIIASNTCRTIETAKLVFNRVDIISNGLLPNGSIINKSYQEIIDKEFNKIFNMVPEVGKNFFIIGHSGTIKKIDINLDIAESETIIIKRDELGKYHYVARLKARDWFQFDF